MASTSHESWIPANGKFDVQLGTSLNRTLRALKGQPPPKSKLPDREFFSFRFNFVPEGVDTTKPGTAEVRRKENDTAAVTIERASTQPNADAYTWSGNVANAKDVDCVLIFDPDTRTFTMEKLDSSVILLQDQRRRAKYPHSSPAPANHPTASSSSSSSSHTPLAHNRARNQAAAEAAFRLEEELERGISVLDDVDAPGDPEDEFEELVPDDPPRKAPLAKKEPAAKSKATGKGKARAAPPSPAPRPKPVARKEEEEESEGEIIEKPKKAAAPIIPSPVKSAPPKPKKKPAPHVPQDVAPALSVTKERPAPRPVPPPPATYPLPAKPSLAAPPIKAVNKKREFPAEETFDISRVSQPSPPKRVRRSPSPKPKPVEKEFSLALPGGSGISLPPAPTAQLPRAPTTASASTLVLDESDEEEWDDVLPVAAAPPPRPPSPLHRIVMVEIEPEPTRMRSPSPPQEEEERVDFDEDLFAEELNMHLDSEDDEELEAVMSPAPDPRPVGGPMSLNEYAGVVDENIWGDEDDDTTSDDSDDE